jgi:hypothetical protein
MGVLEGARVEVGMTGMVLVGVNGRGWKGVRLGRRFGPVSSVGSAGIGWPGST